MSKPLFAAALLLASACADSNSGNGKGAEKPAVVAPEPSPAPVAIDASGEAPAEKPVLTKRVETIQFPAEDGLMVTADLYVTNPDDAPFIVLFHQAGWSRGEYLEIAPRLNEMGFNCLAVDQRSGGEVNEVKNETLARAEAKKLKTTFVDAIPDMRAALKLVESRYPKAKRIAWGSSYSSALVLYLAGTEPALVHATLSFAPGEYFTRFGKSGSFIRDAAKNIEVPTFITSAKDEGPKWKAIHEAIPGEHKVSFLPASKGNHGSRALWKTFSDSEDYWREVSAFLDSLK